MPFALVVRPAAVTLVDNDEVEEVPRELLELHLRLIGLARSLIFALALLAQQRLVKREIDDAVQRWIVHRRLEPIAIPLCEGEAVERLIRKDVAVGQEEDARLAQSHPLPRPFCRDELMAELICDEGLARSGRERDERILLPRAERLDNTLDRPLLIIADAAVARERPRNFAADLLQERSRFPVQHRHQLGRRREAVQLDRRSGAEREVHAEDLRAVRRVGEPHAQRRGVLSRLRLARAVVLVRRLRLHNRNPPVAVHQHIVGEFGIVALPVLLADGPRRNRLLDCHLRRQRLPPRRLQRRVYEIMPHLRFIHVSILTANCQCLFRPKIDQTNYENHLRV